MDIVLDVRVENFAQIKNWERRNFQNILPCRATKGSCGLWESRHLMWPGIPYRSLAKQSTQHHPRIALRCFTRQDDARRDETT